ncbi:MAG: efflux RND transporter periplasmic adaptor subunit [Myxococcota bacterium]
MRSQGIGAAVAVVLALGAASPFWAADDESETRGVLVATRSILPGPFEIALPAKVGVLEAAADVTLSFEVTGRLERVLGDGARVAEGDELASLDTALEEAQLRQAELRLKDAERELRRVRGLKASSAASQKALDAARIAIGLRAAERDVATEHLSRRRILAPFSGVVTDVRFDPGEVVPPGAPMARLLSFALLKIEVGVPGYEITRVTPGSRARVEVPALPGETFQGTVHLVAPAAADGGHLFEVEVLVPNADGRLRPGMGARARIVTRKLARALVVPLECMVERSGERRVFFVEGGRARAVRVDDAPLVGEELVLPGTLPHRELVVRGHHDLRDGTPVRIDPTVLGGLAEGERVVRPETRLR